MANTNDQDKDKVDVRISAINGNEVKQEKE